MALTIVSTRDASSSAAGMFATPRRNDSAACTGPRAQAASPAVNSAAWSSARSWSAAGNSTTRPDRSPEYSTPSHDSSSSPGPLPVHVRHAPGDLAAQREVRRRQADAGPPRR
ncbi:hypothetical protein [Actinomadura madurae]|uniref:hypothetical protein n=1 Tax=Actinomadura madurae TaxID=1993 RepID=UPI0020D223E8|nr:hypothetical protein [Actinomadura madurae]MCQ0004082.1 hypothetical protein [Actinomadura madurae]